MSCSNETAVLLLAALAACNERMIALSRYVAGRHGVKSAAHALDARSYESGPMIEASVDAELLDGRAVVWGIDVTWDGSAWVVAGYIRANDSQGQYPVQEFPARRATQLAEVPPLADEVIAALESQARGGDWVSHG